MLADGYSRRQYRHDRSDLLSHIDRAMMNAHTADLHEVRASVLYVSAIADATVPSDPVALGLSMRMPRASRRQVIPWWIVDHPMFEALCADVFSEAEFQHDPPFAALFSGCHGLSCDRAPGQTHRSAAWGAVRARLGRALVDGRLSITPKRR